MVEEGFCIARWAVTNAFRHSGASRIDLETLRRLGKDVEYAKYEGEDYSPLNWTYANYVDFCNRMIAWFEKYLKPAVPK